MIITIDDLQSFIRDFLVPISKVNDNCILKITESEIYSLVSATDNTLILYSTYKQRNEDIDEGLSYNINIAEISKFIKVLNCISKEESIDLEVQNNSLVYKSKEISFKFHTLHDGILQDPGIDVNKIRSMDYNTNFNIDRETLLRLTKGSAFATETSKLYFYIQDGIMYGELNDRQKSNMDMYSQKITEDIEGDEFDGALPVSFEILRSMASTRMDEFTVNLNTKNRVFTFNSGKDAVSSAYIASAFVS